MSQFRTTREAVPREKTRPVAYEFVLATEQKATGGGSCLLEHEGLRSGGHVELDAFKFSEKAAKYQSSNLNLSLLPELC